MPRKYERTWSGAEIAFIRRNYRRLTHDQLSHRVRRTKHAVRHLLSKLGLRVMADEPVQSGPASFPTDELPGTPGKVEVLVRRFAMRESLWHPQDARRHVT